MISEADPVTGAMITATLNSTSPHYDISYQAVMPNGDNFKGSETITGTTVGLRGLGMPAPSKFTFTSGNYTAEFNGIITSELALSLLRNTRIRAYGFLNLKDTKGNTAATLPALPSNKLRIVEPQCGRPIIYTRFMSSLFLLQGHSPLPVPRSPSHPTSFYV